MAIITDLKKLRTKSHKFEFNSQADLQDLIQCLERELTASLIPGVGLSAIQINLPLRVAIIRTKTLKLDLYNTEIIGGAGMFLHTGEGCLSVPNQFFNIIRMNNITIKNGDGKIYNLEGFDAVVIQHELDHFEGITILDRKENGGI